MERERPNSAPDAGVANDNMTEAHERTERIEKDSGLPRNPENDKAKGNGDDTLEEASVSGRETDAPRKTSEP